MIKFQFDVFFHVKYGNRFVKVHSSRSTATKLKIVIKTWKQYRYRGPLPNHIADTRSHRFFRNLFWKQIVGIVLPFEFCAVAKKFVVSKYVFEYTIILYINLTQVVFTLTVSHKNKVVQNKIVFKIPENRCNVFVVLNCLYTAPSQKNT